MDNTGYQVSNKRTKQNNLNRSRIGTNSKITVNEHRRTFVVRADEKLTAFAELKSATWAATKRPNYGGL
jgi:hypothetical protein